MLELDPRVKDGFGSPLEVVWKSFGSPLEDLWKSVRSPSEVLKKSSTVVASVTDTS